LQNGRHDPNIAGILGGGGGCNTAIFGDDSRPGEKEEGAWGAKSISQRREAWDWGEGRGQKRVKYRGKASVEKEEVKFTQKGSKLKVGIGAETYDGLKRYGHEGRVHYPKNRERAS